MIQDDVELLDYCILAYQLHSQTLVCAIDPYSEQMRPVSEHRRQRFLEALDDVLWRDQNQNPQQYADCRGNVYSVANGWALSGATLDSIPGDYRRISPHHPGFVRQNTDKEGWIVYKAPAYITDPISDWYISSYQSNRRQQPNAQVVRAPLAPQPPPPGPPRGYELYCFEGVTGVTRHLGGAWSLMGYVLARDERPPAPNLPRPPFRFYDVVVVFRGSRSGELRLTQSVAGQGNPDWASNTYNEESVYPAVANANANAWKVHAGFAEALQGTLPAIVACLNQIRAVRVPLNQSLRSVYVTGHSLGGALAACFASAVAFGNDQGLAQYRAALTPAEKDAWRDLKLVTFAAPPFANSKFRQHYNIFIDRKNYRLEKDIVPKGKGILSISTSSAGRITDLNRVDWRHTGKPITLPFDGTIVQAHSPEHIRGRLQESLRPPQQPAGTSAWRAPDNETPWREVKNNFAEVLRIFHQIRRPPQGAVPFPVGCYKFKFGLGLYMHALMEIKTSERVPRFTPQNGQVVTQFMTMLAQNPFPPLNPIQTQFDTQIATIEGIAGEVGLIRMLKHWLALIAAEEGFDWFPQQASPQHAALKTWFEIQ